MPSAATRMDLEIIILSEVRERQIPYDITSVWNLKYDTNELIYETGKIKRQKDTDIKDKLMVTRGGRRCGRDKLGV